MNGWSEALRQELQPAIRVTVIEPGAVDTELTKLRLAQQNVAMTTPSGLTDVREVSPLELFYDLVFV